MVRFLRRTEGLIIGSIITGIMILPLLWAFFFQPPWLLNAISPFICPNAAYYVQTDRPVVALTIDDGPDISTSLEQSTTTQLLSLLGRHHAHATFFPISSKLNTPLGATLTQQIVQQGHELGNHFTEDVRSIKSNDVEFTDQLKEAGQTLAQFASTRWFRPSGGWCSARNAQITKSHHYKTVLGTVWPYDTHITSRMFASWHIVTTIQPGSIIVLHDSAKDGEGSDRGQRAVSILQNVLPRLEQQGYQVVSLSELESYGSLAANPFVLPHGIDTIRRRMVSGLLQKSLASLPSQQAWGSITLCCFATAIILVWVGFHEHFLRWQWIRPPSPQTLGVFYLRVIVISFFLPALVEEFIFRLLLLPSPGEISSHLTAGQWLECAVSISLYVIVHPLLNGPLREYFSPHTVPSRTTGIRTTGIQRTTAIAYSKTFQNPTFLILTTILGIACTMLYLQSQSIWPPFIFHWLVVVSWLLCFGGYRTLHPLS